MGIPRLDEPASAPPSGVEELTALPVLLDVAGPDALRVAAWVEGVLGWQPVEGDGVGLVPGLRLVDPATSERAAVAAPHPRPEVPTVLLVPTDAPPLPVARAAVRIRPDEVVAWPDERDRLPDLAGRLRSRAEPREGGHELRVGGASGGVGTTTVALAVAALTAWQAGPTLLLTHGTVPVAVPRIIPADGLAGPRTWSEAHAVAGVPGLRVLRVDRPVPDDAVAADGARVVRDVGVAADVDVLIARRDAAGLAAIERSVAAAVVLVDDGVVPMGAMHAAAGGRRVVVVPRSVRVARAAVRGRVPVALPGSFLRVLAPLAPGRPVTAARRS